MKRGIWILLGVVILAVGIYLGSLVFAPRVAEAPTPTEEVVATPEPEPTKPLAPTAPALLPGVAPEDFAYAECCANEVLPSLEAAFEDHDALDEAMGARDLGASKTQVLLLESRLQVAKAALLACPAPKHTLLVSSRENLLRSIDVYILGCQYVGKGLSTGDASLINKGNDAMQEAIDLFLEAGSDIETYRAEVLGK